MNRNILFAVVIIALLATSAAVSIAPATPSSLERSTTPQQSKAPVITIPATMKYEINGTLLAWIDLSGYALLNTNINQFKSLNITIREFYIGIKVTVSCTNITVDSITGVGSATVNVTARLVGRMNIYVNLNGTQVTTFIDNVDEYDSLAWNAKWFVPWGDTKNFTAPIPVIGPEQANSSTANPDPLKIVFTSANVTSDSIQYATIRHVQWDFSDWMRNKLQSALDQLWGSVGSVIPPEILSNLLGGFNVVRSIGKIDLWLANATVGATPVRNVLLMAGGLINLLVRWSLLGSGSFAASIPHIGSFNVDYDVNLAAEGGLIFALSVTSDYYRTHNLIGDNKINTFTVKVPENGTLTWKKIGVIVYYGSPAHNIEVTGGTSWGYYQYPTGDDKLFFVDYGWDGVPDFATNGTGDPTQINVGNVTGTTHSGTRWTVNLDKATGWIYFDLNVPHGYTVRSITKDGSALGTTQYWVENGVLYVCDDPTSSYVIDFVSGAPGGAELTLFIYVGIAAVALIAVAAFVFMRRRSVSSTVTVK